MFMHDTWYDLQVGLRLRKSLGRFASENEEVSESAIVTYRGIFERRGGICAAEEACEVYPLQRWDRGGCGDGL